MLGVCAEKLTQWNKHSVGSVQGKLKKLKEDLDKVRGKERTQNTFMEEQQIQSDTVFER